MMTRIELYAATTQIDSGKWWLNAQFPLHISFDWYEFEMNSVQMKRRNADFARKRTHENILWRFLKWKLSFSTKWLSKHMYSYINQFYFLLLSFFFCYQHHQNCCSSLFTRQNQRFSLNLCTEILLNHRLNILTDRMNEKVTNEWTIIITDECAQNTRHETHTRHWIPALIRSASQNKLYQTRNVSNANIISYSSSS